MKIYSIIGTNAETIDQTSNPVCPPGHIEMAERRSTPDHIAQEDGSWLPPLPPTPEQIQAQLSIAVQTMLDSTVQERGYDDIKSACSYVTSTNPTFAAEAQACVEWRDNVWATCYDVLGKTTKGKMAALTADKLLARLPKIQWPEVVEEVAEKVVGVRKTKATVSEEAPKKVVTRKTPLGTKRRKTSVKSAV